MQPLKNIAHVSLQMHMYMQVEWLLKHVEFVIVPVVNPDGYVVRNVTNCIRVHVRIRLHI